MSEAHGNVWDANDVIFAAENRLTAIANTSMDGMHGQRWHQRRSRQLAPWSKTGKRKKWFLSVTFENNADERNIFANNSERESE